ncbi:ornithine cyclodeaminase family protein [Bosea vaviloviae]|uniref:Ornithine cyclodeaminase family protein n=1 Tax=Bosea vaviloviae TaxID=1526658 RepID=A0A1D7U656_9HYPH|nr:ornithine cyclodeaminase family protein [Bosea vaviloviae]AOO82870.1 ornithine cyclodeaminase family protein [Bosea vaviloviae]
MIFVSEEESARLITHELAFSAVRAALIAAASDDSRVFPAVLGRACDPVNTFSVKSGSTAGLTGLKVGSFWSRNPEAGLPRHNSAIILLDQASGRLRAVIEAGRVNAYRTAAADAVAAELLARPDAETLALFGAGNQARHELSALRRIRPIKRVYVIARSASRAGALIRELQDEGLEAMPATAEEACRAADIIVTATPAREPLFEAQWVRPGTHVASMGSDAPGKQELPPQLFASARLFCDLPSQSTMIGEFQHVRAQIEAGALVLGQLGAALDGRIPGRVTSDEITVFDSSGISIQDLYIGQMIVDAVS